MTSAPRPRVLFVDDDLDLLAALRQSLRRERRRWDVSFAGGADEARELLSRGAPFEVLVTDLRMPGSDGAALLEHAQRTSPSTLRFVLSGECSDTLALRAAPYAHQWLAKPCDRALLVATIERGLDVAQQLGSAPLRSLVGGLVSVPVAPSAYIGLLEAMKEPSANAESLGRWVERDASLAARVLQLTNSSFIGLRRRVERVGDAVAVLGTRMLMQVVLTAELFQGWGGAAAIEGFSPEEEFEHAGEVVRLAARIARDTGVDVGCCVSSALLHDFGTLIFARQAPEVLAAALTTARTRGVPFSAVEEEFFGRGHAVVGAAVLQAWGLPLSIVEAVLHHHDPTAAPDAPVDVAAVIHVANALATGEAPDAAVVGRLGGPAALERWRAAGAAEEAA